MLFPKAPETEIEITKIIGYNYKENQSWAGVKTVGTDFIRNSRNGEKRHLGVELGSMPNTAWRSGVLQPRLKLG